MNKIKAVFIDRDGTINADKGYVYKSDDFEPIPGSIEALRLLTQKGIKIYIITNQAGIAKGYYTEEQYHAFTKHMISIFRQEGIEIERVLYCPHHPEGIVPEYTQECMCRKPNTKMLEEIITEKGYTSDELALIGDKNSDIEAGYKLKITTYLVLTGYGNEYKLDTKADYIRDNLLRAALHLVEPGKDKHDNK